MLDDRDASIPPHALDQRAHDLGARAIAARVHDAPLGVRGLAPEEIFAERIDIEVRAGFGELAHAARPFAHEHVDRVAVAEDAAGGERVLTMQRGRIAGAERGGDAALGVVGGAVEE